MSDIPSLYDLAGAWVMVIRLGSSHPILIPSQPLHVRLIVQLLT